MLKITKGETRTGKQINISTHCHWSEGIITIYEEGDQIEVKWSSGGANDVPTIDLARAMKEAWTEAVEIIENIVSKQKEKVDAVEESL